MSTLASHHTHRVNDFSCHLLQVCDVRLGPDAVNYLINVIGQGSMLYSVTDVSGYIPENTLVVGSGLQPRDVIATSFTISNNTLNTHGGNVTLNGGNVDQVQTLVMNDSTSFIDVNYGQIIHANFDLYSVSSLVKSSGYPGVSLVSTGISPPQLTGGRIRTLVAGINVTITELSDGNVQISSSGGGGGAVTLPPYVVTNVSYANASAQFKTGVLPIGTGNASGVDLTASTLTILGGNVITNVQGITFVDGSSTVNLSGGNVTNIENITLVDASSTINMNGGNITNIGDSTIANIVKSVATTGASLVSANSGTPAGRIRRIVGTTDIGVTELNDGQVQVSLISGNTPAFFFRAGLNSSVPILTNSTPTTINFNRVDANVGGFVQSSHTGGAGTVYTLQVPVDGYYQINCQIKVSVTNFAGFNQNSFRYLLVYSQGSGPAFVGMEENLPASFASGGVTFSNFNRSGVFFIHTTDQIIVSVMSHTGAAGEAVDNTNDASYLSVHYIHA